MSIAFWRNIGFIYPFLIGCQAKLPCKKVKENDLISPYRIRHKMQRQGEFLKSWLQWRLLQERRIPAQVEKELRQYLECGILLGVCASEV